jgi:lysozyme
MLIDELTKQLRRDEGVIPHAYQDSLGFWSIGCGRLIDKRKNGGLSQDEIGLMLMNDINRSMKDVLQSLPWAVKLSEPRLGVLVAMRFNLGMEGLLGFKKFLSAMERGDISAAAAEMSSSAWWSQVGDRAKRLRQQLLENAWK